MSDNKSHLVEVNKTRDKITQTYYTYTNIYEQYSEQNGSSPLLDLPFIAFFLLGSYYAYGIS